MTRLPASAAREQLPETINRVAFGGERVVIQRRGKDIAAIISMEDYTLLRAIEDKADLTAARKAWKERSKTISWEKVKAKLSAR